MGMLSYSVGGAKHKQQNYVEFFLEYTVKIASD